MKKILFSFTLTLLFSSSSVLAEWKYLGEISDQKIRFYIDTENIKHIANEIFSFTTLEDFGREIVVGGGVFSIITDKQIDCETYKFRNRHMRQFTGNMGTGEQIFVLDISGHREIGADIWFQIDQGGKNTWQNGLEIGSKGPLMFQNFICTN